MTHNRFTPERPLPSERHGTRPVEALKTAAHSKRAVRLEFSASEASTENVEACSSEAMP